MKVLVTGGAGFIGSHLVRALLDRDDEVTVLDDFSGKVRDRLDGLARVRVLEGDIRDPEIAGRAAAGQEAVFHLAAVPSIARSFDDPARTVSANVGGTVSIMVAAASAGVRRVVLASSSSVYGPGKDSVRRESDCPDPRSPYAASKLAAESIVHTLGAVHGIETVVLRYFNVFGPRQEATSEYAAAIPRFVTALLRGRRPLVFGDGSATRDFTHVDNVVRANLLAARPTVPSGITCNVGSGGAVSISELLDALSRELRVDARPTYGRPRIGEAGGSVADVSRANALLGYEIVVPFLEGLTRTVAWYQERLGLASERVPP